MPANIRRYIVDLMERYYDVADDVLLSQVLEPDALPGASSITMDEVHVYLRAVGAQTDELLEDPEVYLCVIW